MKVYLAHNFAARSWLAAEIIPKLELAGHEVTSRWITDDMHLLSSNNVRSAVHDLEDVEAASSLIIFAEMFGETGAGKYLELGYALRAGKRCIVIGEGSCIFYGLPNIRHAKDLDEAIRML